jgi:HSP20 family molecular chaperone IbpA
MANEASAQDLQVRQKQEVEQEGTRPGLVFRPDVDIVEQPDAYVIYADVPGADDKSVQVRLEKDTLTLDAQLAMLPGADWSPLHVEYRFGGYHREFRISDQIDVDAVTASMRDGVLELRVPKAAQRRPRTIEVRTG